MVFLQFPPLNLRKSSPWPNFIVFLFKFWGVCLSFAAARVTPVLFETVQTMQTCIGFTHVCDALTEAMLETPKACPKATNERHVAWERSRAKRNARHAAWERFRRLHGSRPRPEDAPRRTCCAGRGPGPLDRETRRGKGSGRAAPAGAGCWCGASAHPPGSPSAG